MKNSYVSLASSTAGSRPVGLLLAALLLVASPVSGREDAQGTNKSHAADEEPLAASAQPMGRRETEHHLQLEAAPPWATQRAPASQEDSGAKPADWPNRSSPLPYPYALLRRDRNGSPLYSRQPTPGEEEAIEAAGEAAPLPEPATRLMDGFFGLALTPSSSTSGEDVRFLRTLDGRYVSADAVDLVQSTRLYGELINCEGDLPLAFVFGEDRPLFRRTGEGLVVAGTAERYARFQPDGELEDEGTLFVEAPGGLLLARDGVRVARVLPPPAGIPDGARWIHVDLSSQTLVAYDGQRPRFATIFSGGKEGHEAPVGAFRIQHKLITTTMDGPDPVVGYYEVQQVPWTMYYHRGFAIHGAYWHDSFGTPRSHGCTNLAPADARWLFGWSSPGVPAGRKAARAAGTRIVVTP